MLAVFTVTSTVDSGLGSLRNTIIDASSNLEADEIVFASSTNGVEFDLSGAEIVITESLTLTGNGAANTIIDAQQLSRIFNVQAGDFTLNGVTLKNGRTSAIGDGGGAMASTSGGLLTIRDSLLTGNSTTGQSAPGGAIYSNTGTVTISRSTLSGNATAGSNASGGSIFSRTGAVTISQSTLSGNQATGTDSDGGGLWVDDSAVMVVNSTITKNSAARAGGGLGMFADGRDKKLTMHNSIVAGNTAASTPDFTAPFSPATNLEVRSSLIGRGDGTSLMASSIPDANGNLVGGSTSVSAINPQLGPLANNGGPTQTHALLINSPAFNRGNNVLAVDVANSNAPLTTDQRGTGFARNNFGIVDMGALESTVLDSPEGTTGPDAFVVTYSSIGTVIVTVSSNGGPVINLGIFPKTSPLTIKGLGGTDSIRIAGSNRPDIIYAGSSTSLLFNYASLILTSIENRILAGGAGDDIYKFNADAVLGLFTLDESGGGTDTIDFSPTGTAGISLNLGNGGLQIVSPSKLSLILGSVTTFENAIGGVGSDTLTGNSLNNSLFGNGGNDKLNGGGGSDTLLGGSDNDTYVFGTAVSPEADVVIESGPGIDTLSFSGMTTPVDLNLGSSAVQNVHTNRTLKLNSISTFENAVGSTAADTLTGNGLNNSLTGGPGNDQLDGSGGSDTLSGGFNNDVYVFGRAAAAEADVVNEFDSLGIDTLSFSALTTSVVLNLGFSAVQNVHLNRTLRLNSISTFENAVGGIGDDTLTGNSLNNTLTAGNGDNILIGLAGNDILNASRGRDILIGGLGLDTLNGGGNEDILIAGRTTSDTIIASLNDLRTAWVSADTYAARITSLRAGVGTTDASLKAKVNVLNDAGEGDVLTGGDETDWYFSAINDVIADLFPGENNDLL